MGSHPNPQAMVIRNSRHRRENPEVKWGETTGSESRSLVLWLMGGCLLLLAGSALGLWFLRFKEGSEAVRSIPVASDEIRAGLDAAEAVARAFLAETDPAKRLQWVRNADAVDMRLAEYPDDARREIGQIEKVLGHQMDGGRAVTGFVVAFPSGNLRLLEVVGTPDGPKVDWDAYARYGTASWEDLWSGKAPRAVVRVFCEPATEAQEPFADREKWTAFRLSSPDLPQLALGFAKIGTVREAMMKKVVLGSPRYRQRFVLEVVRHEGAHEALFEITRCLAVGWSLDERPVEEVWADEMAAAVE